MEKPQSLAPENDALTGRTQPGEPLFGAAGGFFGRAVELARLESALAASPGAAAPRGVIVLGEPGLGKTRLVETFLSQLGARGQLPQVLRAAGSPRPEAPAFALLRDLLSAHFGLAPCDAPDAAREKVLSGVESILGLPGVEAAQWIGHLAGCDFSASPHLRGRLDDPPRARQAAFQALGSYLTALAATAPLILWCDNLQWADDASLDWLNTLVQDRGAGPVLVLGAARPELLERQPLWAAQGEPACLRLPPLPTQDCLRLARALLENATGAAAQTVLVRKIDRLAGGNPQMIAELARVALADGPTALDRAPAGLDAVLRARIERLPEPEREALRGAAVTGPVFWEAAVGAALPQPPDDLPAAELPPILDALAARGWIAPHSDAAHGNADHENAALDGSPEYAFCKPLYFEQAYEGLDEEAQRAAHGRVASWLATQPADCARSLAAAIADHYERAAQPLTAAEWYARAAAQSRSAIAPAGSLPSAASVWYQRAADLLPDTAEHFARRAQLLKELWDTDWWQARYHEAQSAAEALLRAAEKYHDLPVQAAAWNCLAAVQNRLGEYPAALRSVHHAERLARQSLPPPANGGESRTGTAPAPAAAREVALALFNRGLALYYLGHGLAAREAGEQALALNQQIGERDGSARGHPGAEAEIAWRSVANEDTTSAAAAAGAVPTTAGSSPETARILTLLGLIHQRAGRYDQAESDYLQVLDAHRRWNDPAGMIEALNNLGANAYLKGDMPMATEFYEAAVGLVRELGSHALELACLTGMAGAQVELGKFTQAETALRGVVRRASPGWMELTDAYRYLALAYLGQKRFSEALSAALQSLDLADQRRSAEQKGRAWRALGSIATSFSGTVMIDGQPCTAHTCYAASLQIFVELGDTGEQARTARAWARYELDQGDPRAGARLWQEARDLFARLGLPLEVQRMDQPPVKPENGKTNGAPGSRP